MTQLDLDRQVARATGESLRTVARRGFSIVELEEPRFDPEPDCPAPQVVDWDAVESQRSSTFAGRRRRLARAA